MAAKEIIIRVDNERVYFNPEVSIAIEHTNIPKSHLTFRHNEAIYWKVEMLTYSGDEACLTVKVLQYHLYNANEFKNQKPKRTIAKVLFEKLDWDSLEPLLSFYQKANLQHVLSQMNADNSGDSDEPAVSANAITSNPVNPITPKPSGAAKVKVIEQSFWIEFSEIQFKLGYVLFSKPIKEVGREISFKIFNDHILAEFENVKYWFSKILKTKKIKVAATITMAGDTITQSDATSEHIDKITPGIIDSVKYQRTHALLKAPTVNMPDKSLFTAEDIFNQFAEDEQGNTFRQTDMDILSFLMEKSSVRNKSQLQYLAGGKQTENNKLRYTLHPTFGFLFLIEGAEKNHFIWELLNTHATYIWSIGKSQQSIEAL